MKDPKLAQQSARNEVLKLLSDEELARFSNAGDTNRLAEVQEDLAPEHLDQGAQHAKAQMIIDGSYPSSRCQRCNLDEDPHMHRVAALNRCAQCSAIFDPGMG